MRWIRSTRNPTASRYSPGTSRPSSHTPAGSLPPFALCPALPGSDYYEGSATPQRHQLTASLPTTRRATSGASHVPRLPIDEGGAQLNPGSIATGSTAALLMIGQVCAYGLPGKSV